MNSASKQELETRLRSLGRTGLLREFEALQPPSASKAPGGRLKMLALLAAVGILIAAGPRPLKTASQAYREPKAPDFSVMANDGQTYTPDYLKGNVVLLYFWATWCPYCKRAVPHMNTLASEYANAPFTILGICGGKDAEAWHHYIEQHQMRWPQYFDQKLIMAHRFQARDVPTFFLINKDGFIVDHWAGWDDSMSGALEKLIDRTLAQPRRQ